MAELKFYSLLGTTAIVFLLTYAGLTNILESQSRIVSLSLCMTFLLFTYWMRKRFFYDKKINPANKGVLITGCDSGFGNLLARRLDSRGFQVFAGCLFRDRDGAKDLERTCSSRLKLLPLDVTSDESVADALNFVKKNLRSNVFWAVINNAGISKGSSFDFSTIKHFKETIDVNTLGPVRVSKAFLPLLKKSKGRIVNVASTLGRIPIMAVCPYTMSKHATVALSECLNLEMAVWGVRVISIEPETFRTPITDVKAVFPRMRDELKEIDENIVSSYGEEYFEKLEKVMETLMAICSCSNLNIVVDAMESAVTKQRPDSVYKPRWSWYTKILWTVLENVPFSISEKIAAVSCKLMQHPVPKDAQM